MTSTDAATWVGTALAILSTGIAVWQAYRAKNAADRAEEMRDEIAKRNAHSELSALNGFLGAAIRAMDKYGPGAGPDNRRGCSPSTDAAAVRALTIEMTRLRALLAAKFGTEPASIAARVNENLARFGSAENDAQLVAHGGAVLAEIVEFTGNIKNELDGNIYG